MRAGSRSISSRCSSSLRRRSGSWAPTPLANWYGAMCTPSSHSSSPAHAGVGVGELDLAEAQALDLAALQDDAGLDGVEHGVVVARRAGWWRSARVPSRGTGAWPWAWARVGDLGVAPRLPCPRAGSCPRRSSTTSSAWPSRGTPTRSCGLRGRPGRRRAVAHFYPCRNVAGSARVYTIDPRDHLRAERDAEDQGWSCSVSCTATPTPRRTRARRTWPRPPTPGGTTRSSACATTHPSLRSYRIVDGVVAEEPIVVV